MRIKSEAALIVGVVVILSSLELSPLVRARDAEPVVPMGALAHAAVILEQSTGGKVLEIRLGDAAGAPAFERGRYREAAGR